MKLVDIINGERGAVYEMVEPNCDPSVPAYEQWKGLVVMRGTAIHVMKPAKTGYMNGSMLRLSGMAMSSEWERIK